MTRFSGGAPAMHAGNSTTSRQFGRGVHALASALAFFLVSAGLVSADVTLASAPAVADTAPVDPTLPETVTAAALPTVQINGVAWDQIIVGNRVFVTGQFTQARPAGAAPGTNQTPRSNLLAYDLTTGVLITSWAPSLNAQGRELAASADGQTLYVAGDFTQVGSSSRNRIAAVDTQTGALRPFNPNANSRVDAIAVAGNTVYLGGNFTTVGFNARTRLAAVNATTGAPLPWAPSANQMVETMVYHAGTGRVIVGGHFDVLNGSEQLGMGSLDATTGGIQPWAANTVIENSGEAAAISSLTADADRVYGVGWAYFGGGAVANFEGVFAADPATGEIDWIDGGRGDLYDVAVSSDQVHVAGHMHDWGMVDWNPQYNPYRLQYATAIDKRRSPTLTNAYGTSNIWLFEGMPAAQPLHWLPTFSIGSYTGMYQGTWTIDSNGDYTVAGGEFPRVNGINQQGLVRFAKRNLTTVVDQIQNYNELRPTVTPLDDGTVRIGWTAAWDRDNEQLTVQVLRGPTTATSAVIDTFQTRTNWWNRPPLGFVDRTASPGTTQTYRIRVTDPFGNTLTGPSTSATIPAGTAPASGYEATVAADDPAWQWRLGETSGTTGYDRAGSNDLTLNSANDRNVPGALLEQPDPATRFPGTSSTGAVQGVSPYWQPGPQSFSLEAWVRTDTSQGGKILGFGERNSSRSPSNGTDRHLYMNNAGRIYFGVRPDMAARITINSPGTFNDNQWHHIVGSLGADGMKLYVDGNLVASNGGVTKGQVYRGYWRLGGDRLSQWPSQPSREAISADIDEVAVYPTALSIDRIRAHYVASGRSGAWANTPPTASFTTSTNFLTASFDASASSDDGSITDYEWDFGDGETSTEPNPQHTYDAAGTYDVTLTVTDDQNATDAFTAPVTVTDPPPELAADSFERTVVNGLGTADIGGPWTTSGPTSSYAVTGGDGRITGAPGASRAGYLQDVTEQTVDIAADITLETAPSGGGTYVSLIGRRVSNGNDYRVKVRYAANGTLTAYLVRTFGYVETHLASAVVPGGAYAPGETVRVRFVVTGNTSTTLTAKIWRVSSPEPTAWLLDDTSATPSGLQAPGGVGVVVYTSGSWSGALPVVAIDNLLVAPPE